LPYKIVFIVPMYLGY